MHITIVFLILAMAVVLFVSELLAMELVAVLVLLALSFTGVISPRDALSGFSDEAVLTIAGFFVISAAFFNTGIVEALGRRLYRISGASKLRFLFITMLVAAIIAAFMNNVVTTAVLMPAVIAIARRLKEPASQFLMPLSFGAVLGGKATLIGSSTNLAINGLLPRYQMPPFGLFEFTPLGIPLILAGILFMVFVGPHLLPKHHSDAEEEAGIKEYVTEVRVRRDSPVRGKSLAQIDFRGTYDLQILSILRNGEQILPHRDSILMGGDILQVKGKLEQILRIKDAQGLDIKSDKTQYDSKATADTVIVEAILSPTSAFSGRTLRQIRFASRFGADVLGIYRHYESLSEKLSDIRLQFGDVLVVQGSSRRINALRQDPNFLTLDDVEHTPFRKDRAIWALLIFVSAAILAAFKVAPISLLAIAGAAATLLARCISVQDAYDRIEWSAVILIAATIPLGIAMEKTGAAKVLADLVTHYFSFGGTRGVMAGFFIFTVMLTQPMANAACALIMTPIAINVANHMHVNPRAFAVTIAIAASCTFPTPLEPVTAIVYGPGKYRFRDYVRVGSPVTVLVMIVTLLLVPIFWPLGN